MLLYRCRHEHWCVWPARRRTMNSKSEMVQLGFMWCLWSNKWLNRDKRILCVCVVVVVRWPMGPLPTGADARCHPRSVVRWLDHENQSLISHAPPHYMILWSNIPDWLYFGLWATTLASIIYFDPVILRDEMIIYKTAIWYDRGRFYVS